MPARKAAKRPRSLLLCLEQGMALIATANLGLVLFDLSYIPWRDFWLQGSLQVLGFTLHLPLPPITPLVDPLKGIEPQRDTQAYLAKVQELQDQVSRTGLSSPAVQTVLAELREMSVAMIDENPFQLVNKTGTLERIKNRMRDQLGVKSSKEAFLTFWSPEYLTPAQWQRQITFFNRRIQPLLATNYFRQIGENGEFVDRFWRVDLPFTLLFAVELLLRILWIRRRYPSLSWREALVWRWFDLLLLLPLWRWLRIIPVTVRLRDANLLDLEPVRSQFSRGFIASFAEELTEVIVVQTINQVQDSIERGDLARRLLRSDSGNYIDINNTNEISVISRRLAQILVYQVIPQIRPDLEALLHYTLEQALQKSPTYQSLQRLPGMDTLSPQITQQLVTHVSQLLTVFSQGTYQALAGSDATSVNLSQQVIQQFFAALATALQNQQTQQELQSLLSDLLEEIKLNYVKRLSEEDFEQLFEETQQLSRRVSQP